MGAGWSWGLRIRRVFRSQGSDFFLLQCRACNGPQIGRPSPTRNALQENGTHHTYPVPPETGWRVQPGRESDEWRTGAESGAGGADAVGTRERRDVGVVASSCGLADVGGFMVDFFKSI